MTICTDFNERVFYEEKHEGITLTVIAPAICPETLVGDDLRTAKLVMELDTNSNSKIELRVEMQEAQFEAFVMAMRQAFVHMRGGR